MQHYKSLCAEVTIWTILVNTQKGTHTYSISSAYINSSLSQLNKISKLD